MKIEINSITYDCGKMTPREQFHVMRRLAPLLSPIGGVVIGLLDESREKNEVMAEVVASIGPLTEALAEMPDTQLDYVLDKCLLHVKRLDTDHNWHPVYVPQRGGSPIRMYQDIDGAAELRLVGEVIKENLSGFFAGLSDAPASSLSVTAAEASRSN